jgi:ADP-ribosylglycohydrolase
VLGKPVEGWSGPEVRRYLAIADAWPLVNYVPALDPHPAWAPAFKPTWPESTRGRISGMPRDDDLDYTVLCLLVMERTNGFPTADDVADEWLRRLPVMQIFTAERAAYRNLVLGIRPPGSASRRNPYREWIGALIRADVYAYVNAGDPTAAARMAAADASVSHTGDGIAAAMWAAAVISMALAGVQSAESVPTAMSVVPENTRLRAALEFVVDLRRSGSPWEEARDRIAESTNGYGWVHAIPSAATIAASLLWGEGEFGRSIALAVSAGGDTDSIGATVGSAAGALVGASGLPSGWVEPLQDTLRTAVAGVDRLRISDLAARTHRIGQARAATRAA